MLKRSNESPDFSSPKSLQILGGLTFTTLFDAICRGCQVRLVALQTRWGVVDHRHVVGILHTLLGA